MTGASLREHPNSTRKAVVDGLEVSAATVVADLGELEGADLLIADPPRETRQRGEWDVYRVATRTVLY